MAPADFWEDRYAQQEQVWSGRPNHSLSTIVQDMTPGRALDVGCGEGADVIWLAERGWDATGIDISTTAVSRGREIAAQRSLTNAHFVVGDLSDVPIDGTFDLITASFLHSPVALTRTEILRRLAASVSPGGHLLVTSHAAAPPWSPSPSHSHHHFLTPQQEVDELALDPIDWQVLLAETRRRPAIGPDGQSAELDDAVVLLQRR